MHPFHYISAQKQHVLGLSFTFSTLERAQSVRFPGFGFARDENKLLRPHEKNGNHISYV